MSIFGLPLIMYQIPEVEEELPDHFISLPFYSGTDSTEDTSGQVSLGVFDADAIKRLIHDTAISSVTNDQSIHLIDDSTSYQNNSGNDAFIILILQAVGAGIVARQALLYDAPTDNSTAGATLRLDTGSISGILRDTGDRLTIGPIRISNGNYCVIHNSAVATNDIKVQLAAWVVERG